jgi:hypothetical protein
MLVDRVSVRPPHSSNHSGGIMTNNRSNMAFVRQVVAAALAVTMGFSGNAHAVIDFGNTIESVTINTTHPGLSGQSDFRTTATFDTHSGVFDTTTGLQWIRATTLQEGQAQGFRLATTSEFRALMLDKGWAAAGVTDQWTFTGGFSYEEATLSTAFGRSSSSSTSVENLASVSFKRDAVAFAPHITLSVTLGLLDSGGQSQVGALFDNEWGFTNSGGSGSGNWSTETHRYTHDAVLANLSDLESGVYDSSSHATGGNWSGALGGLPQSSVMYFMVANVPEPSSCALISLGLAGGAIMARRRRRDVSSVM